MQTVINPAVLPTIGDLPRHVIDRTPVPMFPRTGDGIGQVSPQ
jgi:hypothetical protein